MFPHCLLWRQGIEMDEIFLLSTCLLCWVMVPVRERVGWTDSEPAAIWSQSPAAAEWGCPLFRSCAAANWHGTLARRAISFLIQSDGCQLAAALRSLNAISPGLQGHPFWASFTTKTKPFHLCQVLHPLSFLITTTNKQIIAKQQQTSHKASFHFPQE